MIRQGRDRACDEGRDEGHDFTGTCDKGREERSDKITSLVTSPCLIMSLVTSLTGRTVDDVLCLDELSDAVARVAHTHSHAHTHTHTETPWLA